MFLTHFLFFTCKGNHIYTGVDRAADKQTLSFLFICCWHFSFEKKKKKTYNHTHCFHSQISERWKPQLSMPQSQQRHKQFSILPRLVPCKYTAETWSMTRFIWTHEPQCMNFTWITVLIKTKWPRDQSCTYKSSCSHSWNKADMYVPEYMRQTVHPHRRYRGHLPPGQDYLAHLWPGIPLSLVFHSTLHQQIWGRFNDSAREMLFWTPDPELDWCKSWALSVQQSVPSWADFP